MRWGYLGLIFLLVSSTTASPYIVVSVSEFDLIVTDKYFNEELTIGSQNKRQEASSSDYSGILTTFDNPINARNNIVFFTDPAYSSIRSLDLKTNATNTLLETYELYLRIQESNYKTHSVLHNGVFYLNQEKKFNLNGFNVDDLDSVNVVDYLILDYLGNHRQYTIDLQAINNQANLTIPQKDLDNFNVTVIHKDFTVKGSVLTGTIGIINFENESGNSRGEILLRYNLTNQNLKTLKLEDEGVFFGEEPPDKCNFMGDTIYNKELDKSFHISGSYYCLIDWSTETSTIHEFGGSDVSPYRMFHFDEETLYIRSDIGFDQIFLSRNSTTTTTYSPDFSYVKEFAPFYHDGKFVLVDLKYQEHTEGQAGIDSIVSFSFFSILSLGILPIFRKTCNKENQQI